MASEKQIKEIILRIAGNPSSGSIKQLAPVWAEAIAKLDEPKVKRATIAPEETR